MKPRSDDDERLVRVHFELEQDEEGYPPYAVETVWAVQRGGGYVVDNIPFFIRGISLGDTISAHLEDDRLVFSDLLVWGGHQTIRILCAVESVPDLRRRLTEIGCKSELSNLPSLVSIDVPPEVSNDAVIGLLQSARRDGTVRDVDLANVTFELPEEPR